MKSAATLRQFLLFLPYALAVWVTAYHGLRGSDVLGLICALLLLAGAVTLVYMRFFRRTVQPGLFSPASFAALGLLGLALGTLSSGEAVVGVVAGLVAGGGAAAAGAVSASRRRRRPKTLFLSYRRADSGDIAPQIRDRLAQRFGAENIFMDIESIELGGRFRDIIADAIGHADALVAIIGDRWLDLTGEEGRRRLDEDDDLVRIEIETALASDKVLVVPLAVKGADLPAPDALPESIRGLAERNGGVVRNPPDFEADMGRLIQGLEQGAVTPWSRAAPRPIAWGRVAIMTAMLLAPLPWLLLEVITRDYRAITAADLSPDRASVATAHGTGIGVKSRVRIWDTGSGALRHTIRAGDGPVWSVAWSPDGAHLAYGDHDGTLVILATADWQERHRFERHSGMLGQIAWAPGGQRVATGDEHGSVRIWNAVTGALQISAHVHADDIEMIRWSPGGDRIASASWDGTVAVTDAASGALLSRMEGHTSYVNAVAWSGDGTRLASGSLQAPYLLAWPADRPGEPIEFAGHSAPVDALAWSPAAAVLASASRDDTVRIWSESGRLEQVLDMGASGGAPGLAWSMDGRRIAGAGSDQLSVWEIPGGRRLHRITAHADDYQVHIVGWWPGGERLATLGSWERTVRIWTVGDPRPRAAIRVTGWQALRDKLF